MSNTYLESLFGLNGKTALVTGGTRGLGKNMALAIAKAGANVILVQRDTSNTVTRDAIRAIGRKSEIALCDLADEASVKTLTKRVTGPVSEGGMEQTLDILVNCGGINRRHAAENYPDSAWDEVIQVNLNACFTLARDVGRHMLESRGGVTEDEPKSGTASRSKAMGRGKIVNVASVLAYQGGVDVPAYAAAKHGVLGLTRALSGQWAGRGINVNAIAPGYIETELTTALANDPIRSRQISERIPQGRWGRSEDLEGVIIYLCSAASDFVSGEGIVVDGGWLSR